MSTFTSEQVADIVAEYLSGKTVRQIAEKYNVLRYKISEVLKENCHTYTGKKRNSLQFITEDTIKVCPKCGRPLPLSEYCLGNGKYGRRSICKECDHKIHNTDEYRERRKLIRDKRRKEDPNYNKKEREADIKTLIRSNDSYKKYMLRSAKERAKNQNIPFDITFKDFELPEYCPLLGIKLNKHLGENKRQDDSPSLDRIIPSLGYIKGNVWVISNEANVIKNNATVEELELITKNLKMKLMEIY